MSSLALDGDLLRHDLFATGVVSDLRVERALPSSHVWLKQNASDLQHGFLLVAEEQTAGKGRGSNQWHSPPGIGIYFSLLLRPGPKSLDAKRLGPFNLLFAQSIAESIQTAGGVLCQLKWPNDLMFRNKKLAGILVEATTRGSKVQYVIASAGINVFTPSGGFPADISATAVALDQGTTQSLKRESLLIEIVLQVLQLWDRLPGMDVSQALDRWLAQSLQRPGASVCIQRNGAETKGISRGLTEEGLLLVETEEGQILPMDGVVRMESEGVSRS